MAVSSRRDRGRGVATVILPLLVAGCSVGVGAGEVSGVVDAPDCGLDEASYRLEPTFFVATPVEDHLEMRVQRGSSFSDVSDGIAVTVLGASRVAERLGEALPIEPRPDEADVPAVGMTLYLNESCPPSAARAPVVLEATEGTITFEAIHAPGVDRESSEIAATFGGVRLTDHRGRSARLSGWFRFIFNRGHPAQRFP